MAEEVKMIKVRAVVPVVYTNDQRYREDQVFSMRLDHYEVRNTEGVLLRTCKSVEPVEGYELNPESGKVEAKVKKAKAKE